MLFALSLASTPLLAAAQPGCGVYQDRDDPDAHLVIESATRASERSSALAPRRFEYRRNGNRLQMVDMDAGYAATFTVGKDGHISDESGFRHYAQVEQASCASEQLEAAAGTCRADLASCADRLFDADETTLRAWCEGEKIPFACEKLIALYTREARQPAKQATEPEMPAVCDEGSATFSEQECLAHVEGLMGRAIAGGVMEALGEMSADAPRLSPERLQQAAAMCTGTGSATVCNSAASALWQSGRYLQARSALEMACVQGEDTNACMQAESLVAMEARDEQAPPADRLPCGTFIATTGLMSELAFTDRGIVAAAPGRQMRARLQDGLVRIRHDKGGDFVLRVLDGNRLLGIDQWNEFSLYERQDPPATCAPPVVYEETPLEMDCPAVLQDGGARACCDAGQWQGCNALGHQYALQGDWNSARPYYDRMCAAGVRSGCENLLHLFANGADESAIASLDRLCANRATHVACDVRETANLDALALARALQEAADEVEAEHEPAPAQ